MLRRGQDHAWKRTSGQGRNTDRSDLLKLTSEIVSAHVSNNAVEPSRVPDLIQLVFDTLAQLADGEAEVAPGHGGI